MNVNKFYIQILTLIDEVIYSCDPINCKFKIFRLKSVINEEYKTYLNKYNGKPITESGQFIIDQYETYFKFLNILENIVNILDKRKLSQ